MDCSELIILDVGHGNCAVVKHGTQAIIIDAPGKPIVARVLDELGITSIHALLISHADSDHLSGAIPILLNTDRPVKHVYVNPDDRTSSSWTQFRIAAGTARRERGTEIHTSLNLQDPNQISLEGTTLRVVHPTPEICLATTSGQLTNGTRNDPNSMSAVVLVEHEGQRLCLLAADAGSNSLESMIDEGIDLKAPILVFPHHGGHVAGTSDNREFAKNLVSVVQPKVVLFSLGRGFHGTPRPEIIVGVREAMADNAPYIACTQISKRCADNVPSEVPKHTNMRSEGYKRNNCCAGTVSLPLKHDGLDSMLAELSSNHGSFVAAALPKALCTRALSPSPSPSPSPIIFTSNG